MRFIPLVLLIGFNIAACKSEKAASSPEHESTNISKTQPKMPTPKEDSQALVDEFLPFAEKMLTKHREFFPFGGRMSLSGEIIHEGAYDGTEQPPSQDLIDLLREAHRQQADRREIRAACIVYDIRTIPPNKTEKQDAISIEIDHRDSYSVVVIFPYVIASDGEVKIDAPFANAGKAAIFKN